MTILRRPALSPDGSQIAFSHQGDIWMVGRDGGKSVRLTIHEGYESYPAWSPDGQRLAFTSTRNGNNDIFTIRPDGSEIRQLTWHSGNDNFPVWLGTDSILFSTNRLYASVEWEDEIYAAGASGGTPVRRLGALGEMAAASPDGRYIAFVRGACR
ncbi:MAG: peptidase S41, partial [Bacteroidia bacterium]